MINEKEIQENILHFIGDEGYKYFNELKEKHGSIWCVFIYDRLPYSTWNNEGRQIRNHIIDKYPNIVEDLGGYDKFEDLIYKLTEKLFD